MSTRTTLFWPRLAVVTGALCLGALAARTAAAGAEPASVVTVQVDRPGAAIPATLFGLFFEDINFAADGGLYPERIKNRSFEFPEPMMGWKRLEGASGDLEVVSGGHGRHLRLTSSGAGAGVANEGFRGIGVEQGEEYLLSFRAGAPNPPTAVRAVLETPDGRSLGEASVRGLGRDWKAHSAVIRATATDAKARLSLRMDGPGTLLLDEVSLYPRKTWGARRHGLRPDLVQLLHDMKPGFLRFPGGCIVEGRHLNTRYEWKKTVGPRENRELLVNRWNTEFKHKPAPDYYQTFGLGFFEYFQLSEDIGAEPLPILNCGMACQFNSGELAPLTELGPYVQDALDLIEFANGPVTSHWGGLRAKMGHPAPFRLKMIGVGNEQWGTQYVERYRVFARILKEKHPEISLIGSVGPSASGEQFDFLWGKMRELNADIVDEHYYMAPKWFRDNAGRYDNYPRIGPKVFAGEYAAQTVKVVSPDNRNNWEGALSEAAFVTGLERNADIVTMSSYAPLFAHVDAWQWTPNMIWFDNLRSYGTPNYYVQKLFAVNRGTHILPVAQKNGERDLFTSASVDRKAGEVIVKLVNTTPITRAVTIDLTGAGKVGKRGTAYVLGSLDLNAENTLDQPTKLAPVKSAFAVSGARFNSILTPNSVTVVRVPVSAR